MTGLHAKAGGERGFALVLVLWSLVLLSLITARLVVSGRDNARLASNLRAGAQAEMLADAAVHEAMFHLLDARDPWLADGAPRRLSLPGGAVVLRMEDQAGLVNPNSAPDNLLRAMLRRAGADTGAARSIAAAIQDWRTVEARAREGGAKAPEYQAAGRGYGPPGAPFRSVNEVGLVLGMTPVLLEQLRPHMTVFYEGDPDPGLASPFVLQALRDATGQADLGGGSREGVRTVAITAEAVGAGGGRFVRRAVVRAGAASGGRPYQVFEWRRLSQ